MHRATITDIFFDLDHTLWDFDRNSALAFDKVFSKHGIDVDLETFLGHYTLINSDYWNRYEQNLITIEELRYGRLRSTFERFGMSHAHDVLHTLSEAYIDHLPEHNHLFDGAIDTLHYLKDKYRLHIITNGFSHVQKKKMANSGLQPFFATITDSEMAGAKKPDPIIFRYALEKAGTHASSSVMIGDSLVADIKGASGAGLYPIHFSPSGHAVSETGFQTIRHLSELQTLF
ncbi:YjjG family noncanonical pyrimidine nucleotidase [Flavobacterium sp. HJ-32-4]|uniref:YjjG family noncanonical pyrimidine nucleotidase n=1 Tax=Flavobacterium sp. HJ-32-4 TaxID=1160795 RepID=UPI001F12CA23|nr:YjjG family noncanonical pyrimidine nucleotidase [Flavobacterium sp. HJ-32-4]UMY66961.1 YjjG family noncanonical pyrimidine nucleotidase [Flavobacterium sp. HJ-32-4]